MDHFNLAKLKKTITIIQHRKEYESQLPPPNGFNV